MFSKVTVKIGLKQEKNKKRIVVEALLDSRETVLVMSKEFTRKHKFRRTKLKRLIYMRNVNRTLNYARSIVDVVEVEIFLRDIRRKCQ